jgi:hypothetical protein
VVLMLRCDLPLRRTWSELSAHFRACLVFQQTPKGLDQLQAFR